MKPFIVVQGPVATRSGYGNHTRDLVTALIKADKYDIQIISLPWGHTPMDALKMDNPDHVEIDKRIARGNINKQPDIFIQISVPNEFCLSADGKNVVKPGKFNIGITAGIETTVVPHSFIEGSNRMDLILTTSEHSRHTLVNTKYDRIDEKTKQKNGELKLEVPCEVLFEGVDLNTYKKLDTIQDKVSTELKDIKEDFCYLYVGHWLKGDIGQDRKDIGMTIKTFCEAFKKKSAHNRPGLILKTSHASFSIMDRDMMMHKIQQILKPYGNNIPNIYLLHGDLTDSEMNTLYNHPKVKAMVSFTKGEGYGRPLAEFARTGKPIIASNWSGQLDFLHKDYCTLLPGQLTDVHKSAADQFILKEAKWFTVDYLYASKVIQDMMSNYKKYLERSRKMPQHIKKNFSFDKMQEMFTAIIDKSYESVPKEVKLKMPELSKSKKDNKIKIPKLKKVNV